DLQPAPVHQEAILLAAERLELGEKLARLVLGADLGEAGDHDTRGQQQDDDQFRAGEPHATYPPASRSATLKRALRARGLRASSSAEGRTRPPTGRSLGRARGGISGRPRNAGSPRDSRAMKRLTMRSSSEWKLTTASRP